MQNEKFSARGTGRSTAKQRNRAIFRDTRDGSCILPRIFSVIRPGCCFLVVRRRSATRFAVANDLDSPRFSLDALLLPPRNNNNNNNETAPYYFCKLRRLSQSTKTIQPSLLSLLRTKNKILRLSRACDELDTPSKVNKRNYRGQAKKIRPTLCRGNFETQLLTN